MSKRVICLLTALCLLAALLSGCASKPEQPAAEAESAAPEVSEAAEQSASPEAPEASNSGTETGTPSGGEVEVVEQSGQLVTAGDFTYTYHEIALPLTEERVDMTLWSDFLPPLFAAMSGMEENSVYIELENRTNIHLDITSVSNAEGSTSVSLAVASGEYPDFWFSFLNYYSSTVDSAVDDEIIYDLSQFKADMPNYYSLIDDNEDLKKQAYTDSGVMGQTYGVFESNKSTQGLVLRQDWLDDLGLAAPETYDEYHDVLAAFHDNYGATYWMNSNGEQYFSQGFDVAQGYLVKDGQLYFGTTTDEFRQYLELMNSWYSEGLIWHDFASSSDMMDEGKAGAGEYGMYDLGLSKYTSIRTSATDPDFALTALKPAVKNAGDTLHVGNISSSLGRKGISLTTHCPSEYLKIACQWLDYWFTPDGSMLANYGIEGESYNLVDGEVVWTDLMLNDPDLNFTWAMNKYAMGSGPFIMDSERIFNDYNDEQWAMMDVFNSGYSDYALSVPSGISLTTEESEQYTVLYSDISTYISENFLLFITGDLSFDQFDDFVAQIDAMNLETCLELQQAAYERYMAR